MSLADLSSREAVLEAMREYDELGREAFLTKYGFDSARRYYVEHDGNRYESKAIAGVAVGKQHPDLGPLKNTEFTGGVASVGRKLKSLGFDFIDTMSESSAQGKTFAQLLADAMRQFEITRQGPYELDAEPIEMELAAERLRQMRPIKDRPHIKVVQSLGKGVWTRTPWIALLDDRVTTSPQYGLYVVLLISQDLKRLYVTLNQGAAKLEAESGRPAARQTLIQRAERYRAAAADLATDGFALDNQIDLGTNDYPSKYYEFGTVAHTDYEFPLLVLDPDLENDLEALLDTYEDLALHGAAKAETAKEVVLRTSPTNLILYGPPGTGKTYHTAIEAVRLCDGIVPDGGRAALMDRYRSLKNAGRIEFVTFHQSFGYEDFVEGLRPQTEAEDGDQDSNSGGFRLKPEPGIFKRIATVAEQSGAAPATAETYDFGGRRFFKMSLGRSADQSEVYEAAIQGGYIALGYGGEYDWSPPVYEKWQAIFDKWRETIPDISPNSGDIVQTYALRGGMKEGDIVIVSDGNSKFRAIGEVAGPYHYVADPDGFRHRRAVRWLRVFEKSLPVDLILEGKFSMMTLHSLNPTKIKMEALGSLLSSSVDAGDQASGQPEPYVLIIDEINRANISKVFGELITLLEPDKRIGFENALTVTLPYSKEEFGVPANLHILGTMNTADRSIALLDTALRRRFRFKEIMPEPERLAEVSQATGINLTAVLTGLNERIEYLFDREHQIGHAYFMSCQSRADVDEVLRNKIIPLLAEYFYENWEKVWQVLAEPDGGTDGSFLTRKKLAGPKGISESYGQDRWRFRVRDDFPLDAYEQLV